MDLRDLVRALLAHDTLAARQWVADASRAHISWTAIPRPTGFDRTGMAVAAGIVETLAERANQPAPPWTSAVPALPEPFLLVRSASHMPRLRRLCEDEGPAPLRRRRLLAPPDFMTVV